MNQLKGVIFDMDGTLVDSKLDFDELRAILGLPEGQMILEAVNSISDPDLRAKKLQQINDYEISKIPDAEIYNGVIEFLSHLKSANIHTAIVTRNIQEVSKKFVEEFSLPIDTIITRECDFKPKPSPEALDHLLKAWNIGPHEALMFGDHDMDIEAAKRAGIKGLHFSNDGGTLSSTTPDFSFDCYQELRLKFDLILSELGLKL